MTCKLTACFSERGERGPAGGQGIWPKFWVGSPDDYYGGWPESGYMVLFEAQNSAATVYGSAFWGNPEASSQKGIATATYRPLTVRFRWYPLRGTICGLPSSGCHLQGPIFGVPSSGCHLQSPILGVPSSGYHFQGPILELPSSEYPLSGSHLRGTIFNVAQKRRPPPHVGRYQQNLLQDRVLPMPMLFPSGIPFCSNTESHAASIRNHVLF